MGWDVRISYNTTVTFFCVKVSHNGEYTCFSFCHLHHYGSTKRYRYFFREIKVAGKFDETSWKTFGIIEPFQLSFSLTLQIFLV